MKEVRAKTANAFIEIVASLGRKFFLYDGRVSRFEIIRGHVYLRDGYRGKLIYTHYRGEWRGFANGGTMRALIIGLRDFIRTGQSQCLNLGPWPSWLCDVDLWGYGADMELVRAAAVELRIVESSTTNCRRSTINA